MVEYFHFLYSKNKPDLYNTNPMKPIDYMCEVIDFRNCKENIACQWTIHMVKTVSDTIHNIKYTETKTSAKEMNCGDIEIQTFEDAYYEALIYLYNTYY